MSSFITQTTSEDPQVLLIAQDCFFSQKIKQFLEKNGLVVAFISPEDLLVADNLEEIKQFPFYKTIYIKWASSKMGENKNKKNQRLMYPQIISFLQEKKEAKVIIAKLTSRVKTNLKITKQWQAQSEEEQKFLDLCLKKLDQTLFLIGQDILAGATVLKAKDVLVGTSEFNYPFKFFILALKKELLLDPQLDFNFQTETAFFNALKLQLLKPHKAKRFLIKGQKISSKKIIEQIKGLYELYFAKKLKITKVFLSSTLELNFPVVACQTSENISKLIDARVRVLPEKIKDLPDLDLDFTQESLQPNTSSSSTKLPLIDLEKTPQEMISPKEADDVDSEFDKTMIEATDLVNQARIKNALEKQIVVKIDRARAKSKVEPAKPEDKLDSELKKIFNKTRVETKIERTAKKTKVTKKITLKSKRKKAMFFGGLIFTVIGCFLIAFLLVLYLAGLSVKKTFTADVNRLVAQERSTEDQTGWGLKFIKNYGSKMGFVADLEVFQDANSMVFLVQKVNQLEVKTQQSREAKKNLLASILGKAQLDPKITLNEHNQLEKELYEELSMFQAELDDLNLALFPPEDKELLESFKEELKTVKRDLSASTQLAAITESLIGLQGKRSYVLLVQDNQELRPTGGFIQAVVLITFDQGALIDYQVFSAEEIDSKVLADVSPPWEITQLLGEEKWFFRDANWDPDFKKSAKVVSWFLSEAFSKEVDGVIAINYLTIQEMIASFGAIELPEHNEVITDKNIFERLEFHARDNPDNSQQQVYSKTLLEALFTKIFAAFGEEILLLNDAFIQSLNFKQTLINLKNKEEQLVINNLGWSGDMITPNCPGIFNQDNCLIDTFYQVEANVSINKVNSYVTRSVAHQIEVFPEYFKHKRVVSIKNNARMNSWPQGTYKTYLRFYLPKEAKFESIKLNEHLLANNQYTVNLEENRQVVGVLVDVKTQEIINLELVYQVKNGLTLPYSYLFFDQKQAGIESIEEKISVIHPSGFRPSLISPQAEVDGKLIVFEGESKEHNFVGISFE